MQKITIELREDRVGINVKIDIPQSKSSTRLERTMTLRAHDKIAAVIETEKTALMKQLDGVLPPQEEGAE